MIAIGFLHTSPVHTATFEALTATTMPDATAVSTVAESLLAAARDEGPDSPRVVADVERAVVELVERGADVVVCTCSTIGGVAEAVGRRRGCVVIRVDRPMVERAVASGSRIAVVAAVESTVGPTRDLIEEVSGDEGRDIDVAIHVVDGAWARFQVGDQQGYIDLISAALPGVAVVADVIVLAQASMAAASDAVGGEIGGIPVLSSPRSALDHLRLDPSRRVRRDGGR